MSSAVWRARPTRPLSLAQVALLLLGGCAAPTNPPPSLSYPPPSSVRSGGGEPSEPTFVVPEASGDDLAGALSAAPEKETLHSFNEELPAMQVGASAPSSRHAALNPTECRSELGKRALPAKPAQGPAKGIAAPVRITGAFGEVTYAVPGAKSVYGQLDCRLALVLDDLVPVLRGHAVRRVFVDNLYRPHPRGARRKSQHAHGLAIDVTAFELDDGRRLVVEQHWPGQIGEPACGPEARLSEPSEEALALRNLLCDIARRVLFHHILTPNYDAAHRDHFHLDIKRDAKVLIVR